MVAAAVPDPIMAYSADQWRASAARDALLPFVRRMFPRYEAAAHHRRIAAALERVERGELDRLLIVMPPRHGKSELASKHFPAWYLGRHPEKRVIACSYTANLAYRFSRQARNVVADPRWPFAVGLADDLASVQSWDLATGGGYIAAGVGGSITGQGADLLIIDDPVKNAEDADSEVKREHVWQWYQDTAYPRLHDGAAVIVIGTRWHDDDLIGRLLAAQGTGADTWEVLHLPAIDDAGAPLWPERYPLPELLRRKVNMSGRMWEAQYQGQPLPAEGGMFPRSWWRRYRTLPKLTRIELCLDSAFKEGVANDYSVYALWGTDGQGNAYLIRVWRQRVDFPKLIQLGYDAYAWAQGQFPDLHPTLVIEDKASGQSAIQVFAQASFVSGMPRLPVVSFKVDGTQSKVARAEGVTGMVEGGQAHIPERADWLEDWLAEHERFPLGAHDDQVDTTGMALTRLLLKRRKKARIY
jgi:predicted phage terminase large subunit-like protein